MIFANQLIQRFSSSIVAILSCFDRVIFKGYLPFGDAKHLNHWVDCRLGILRKDFLHSLEKYSNALVQHAKNFAKEAQRPYLYRPGKFSKEKFIQEVIRDQKISEGFVAVLCTMETCRTVKMKYAANLPQLFFARRPQRVLYYYHIDPEFGLMHIRIETWFPYAMQVYVNGHSWLAQQMSKFRIPFVMHDNAFTQLDNPVRAQEIADRFAQINWIKQLGKWAVQVNPHIRRAGWLAGLNYYWVTEQAEYASDVIFTCGTALKELYKRFLDHAAVNFSAQDILSFLGRKLSGNFLGEVLTDTKMKRWPGARVKHRVKGNWLKMYDKFGLVLRVETVINQPREFRVRRKRIRNGRNQMVWCPMNKGVANLPSYQRVARNANHRYFEALAQVHDPSAAYHVVAQLSESKIHKGRRYAGFNPANRNDVRLFRALLAGENLLHGFRNASIREQLWGTARDPDTRRRQANAVTRLIKRCHVRALVAKIPRTRRWRVTRKGRKVLGIIVHLHYHGLSMAA